MKGRVVGPAASVLLLLGPAPLNVVRCEPVVYTDLGTSGLYEFTHSFAAFIEAAREVDRRVRLCGDPSMQPYSITKR